MWNDEKFRAFSDDAKLAFMFVLTHPHMTSVGAMRATIAGLAAELGWPSERLSEAFREPFAKGVLKLDPKACFLCLPNFVKHNPPESPNVIKGWVNAFDSIPECALKYQLYQELKGLAKGLGEAFRKAFDSLPEALAKGMPNQEQEQEQDTIGTAPAVRESKPVGGDDTPAALFGDVTEKPARKEPDSAHHRLRDYWCKRWEEKYGQPYPWGGYGGKNDGALKTLRSKLDNDEGRTIAAINTYLAMTADWCSGHPLQTIISDGVLPKVLAANKPKVRTVESFEKQPYCPG
jgi:hypothetical protein